jgi:hypothetical protein
MKYRHFPYPDEPVTGDAKRKVEVVHIDEDIAPDPKRPKTQETTVSQQDLFLIHCRDNLISGSTGPKHWPTITKEFNKRFKDVLKKPLAWKTLQKRAGTARKVFELKYPDYQATIAYPVPAVSEDEDQDALQVEAEYIGQEEDVFVTGEAQEKEVVLPQKNDTPQTLSARMAIAPASSHAALHPGAYTPSSISPHHIFLVDRAKHHLRRRAHERATFQFLDADEAQLVKHDKQSLDHDTLVNISPLYARLERSDPDRPIDVPAHFCTKTVNAFIQIIAPVPAKSLPTHYLWCSATSVPGVYDRFGAIEPEKIHWSVDNLLELHAFAHYMEVHWIGDMVVDRLHWMFCEQKRQGDMCQNINENHGWIEVNGKMELVGRQLPSVPNLETCTLSAGDFDTQALGRLMVGTIEVPALTFYADLMKALGGALDAIWLSRAPQQVQDIFVVAAASPRDLINMSREQFCYRYHHHSDNGICYTAAPDHTAQYLVHQLYATSSRNELIKLSSDIAPPESLATIMYKASGTSKTLEKANSSPDMLDAEKMVMEMEMRLEDAKAALHKARAVDRRHKVKDSAIQEAKNLAKQLIKPLKVVQK